MSADHPASLTDHDRHWLAAYDALGKHEKVAIDVALDAALGELSMADLPTASDVRADKLKAAIARYVIESGRAA